MIRAMKTSMTQNIYITPFIQSHKSDTHFDYNIVVEWAIGQLELGADTPNMLMLASFGPPFEVREISPYIAAALKDLGLQEKDGDDAVKAVIRYYLNEVVLDHAVRKNLRHLFELHLEYDSGFDLMPFYLLYHAWYDLESGMAYNHYYNIASLENIESILKQEALEWLENN